MSLALLLDTPFYLGNPVADSSKVPWLYPCAINDHYFMLDLEKTRWTTLQVRRVSADDSVEPGEQTLSAAGVWPRAQDNWFLGAGQKYMDNRFAFEAVYVHSGETPSVRTRFWKSYGVNPWKEGTLELLPEYASIASSTVLCHIVTCGTYLYRTDGDDLWFTNDPVGIPSPTWTQVTTTNTQNIVSLTSDGSRVWFACGSDGVYVTTGGTTSVAAASTPPALNGIQGATAVPAGAGTVNATNLPNGSTTWYISEVDAFGNETAATAVTAVVASTPVNLAWDPDIKASSFIVRRHFSGADYIVYNAPDPEFVDDGTVGNTNASAHPTANATGTTAYPATFIAFEKAHLIASTGRDLVEILADGSTSFIYQAENPAFVFTCACEVPSAILVGGFAGDLSFIGAVQPDTTIDGATLAPPSWATTLPRGETINAMAYSAGSMLLGTSAGIRSGTRPDSTGVFDVNPVIQEPGAVLCLAPWGQYEYFGWANYDPTENWAPERVTSSGVGRADLSQFSTLGVPAYANDVQGYTTAPALAVTDVVVMEGVPYFVVQVASNNFQLYGPDGLLVDTAWLEPGWVRFGTLENKIAVEIDFQTEPLPRGASVEYSLILEDQVTPSVVGNFSTPGATELDTPIFAGLAAGRRFMPIITLNSTPDQTQGPTFISHIIKSMVTTRRQREVLLGIDFREEQMSIGPADSVLPTNLAAEFAYLTNLEDTGQVITLKFFGVIKQAYVDQIMGEPQGYSSDRLMFQGILTVKVITLN